MSFVADRKHVDQHLGERDAKDGLKQIGKKLGFIRSGGIIGFEFCIKLQ